MRVLAGRRPEVMLLAALLVFGLIVVLRGLQPQPVSPLAVDLAAPAPAPVERGDERALADLQERIRQNPNDTDAYAQLGLAQLQRVRESGDLSLYGKAESAFAEALARDPQQFDALVGQGQLALARHQFADALRWGERASAVNPFSAHPYGIMGDAHVELGQYDAAVAAIQKMVDTRPDLNSYSRVSYLRELHGDADGAIAAMRQAVEAGAPGSEALLWTQVQLGHLYFNRGDLAAAERIYLDTLQTRPDYIYAWAGVARVRAAQGHTDEAVRLYQETIKRLPLPEFVIALGELYDAAGRPADARRQYDLVRAMQQLNAGAGMDVGLELALFDADHPLGEDGAVGADPAATVELARAAYARRPSIYAADALAWALYTAGDYTTARRYSQEALRLGTRDAALHHHAGMIAFAMGDRAMARAELEQALAINPYFSARHAPTAQVTLNKLRP
jgi:tetratricopeptide (TPR) repeat protein